MADHSDYSSNRGQYSSPNRTYFDRVGSTNNSMYSSLNYTPLGVSGLTSNNTLYRSSLTSAPLASPVSQSKLNISHECFNKIIRDPLLQIHHRLTFAISTQIQHGRNSSNINSIATNFANVRSTPSKLHCFNRIFLEFSLGITIIYSINRPFEYKK